MPGAGELLTYVPPSKGTISFRRVSARPGDGKEKLHINPDLKAESEVVRAYFPPLVYTYSGEECVYQPPDMWWKKDVEMVQVGWKKDKNGNPAVRLIDGRQEQVPVMVERVYWTPDLERTKKMGPPPSSERSRACGKAELNWLKKYGPIQAEVPMAGGIIAYPMTATKADGSPMLISTHRMERDAIEASAKAVRRYQDEAEKMEAQAEIALQKRRQAVEERTKARLEALEADAELRFKQIAEELSAKYDVEKLLAPAGKKQKQA